jgi:tetratricopeptide (TPR) repeat protein/transcriptional regulator with XRE-family HTH domain
MSADDTTAPPSGPTALGALLRALRKRALLTQEELAERAGLSATTIKNFETGRIRRPRLESIRLLADTLGLSAAERETLVAAAKGDAPDLPAAAAGASRPLQVPQPPRLLPADVADFTGRERQVKALEELLGGDGEPAERATAVAICAVVGMAGVGKTALAVHWAHRAAARFPDGQLYVNLRGYAAGPPLDPVQALARLLRALGVGADHVPVEVEEAAELYRSLLAGRRVLIVLDNAHDSEQVRPLLPGTPGCVVVVTSRDRLAGLVATHGARRLTLDVLTPEEAVELLGKLVGRDRGAEPAATADLARLCANLPLALRVAVANLASYPDRSIGAYVADLRADDRLARLAVDDDPQAAVGAAFDVSYQRLTAEAQRLFRLLGLVPGPDVTIEAAAALAGAPPRHTAGLLDRLVGANLVEARGPDRFAFHDLLRRYAEQRARLDDDAPERDAAARRLLGWYLRGCDAAARRLYPQMLRLPAPADEARPPAAVDDAAALAWLDAELPNLVAAVESAAGAGAGLPELAWRLADALRGYFWLRRCKVEWLAVTDSALAAVTSDGDPLAHAAVRLSLGDAHDAIGRQLDAIEHYTAALGAARQAGWLDGEAGILSNLGLVHWGRGELRTAADHQVQALALYRRTGRAAGQAITLGNLGLVHGELGQLRQAAADAARSLALHRELGNRGGEGSSLNVLGSTSHHLGRFDRALDQLSAALALSRETGNRFIEACTLDALAALHHDAGRRPEALESAAAALRLAAELGEHWVEADAHNTLGTIELHLGNERQALDHHAEALELARRARSRSREAAALIGLAAVHLELGCHDQTTDHAGQALALARQTGNRLLEGRALAALAAADLARGHAELAAEHAREALVIQREVGHRLGQARTLVLLGHALERASGPDAALPSWREALTVLTDIGSPEAEALRAILPAPQPGAR